MGLLLSFRFFFAVFLMQVFCSDSLQEAKFPGDIIIGGLFPIHESVSITGECNRFSVGRLVQSLMMVHAIEEINQSGELGNITLGYHIVDSCADVTTALRNTLSFMKMSRKNSNTDGKQQLPPPVMAVIGDYYSEISIAVTRQLNLEKIPEISYGSTSGLLSDKTRFPSFMRTVPEDDHQARAIIEIIKGHKWNWIGIVATDGEYGRYAVERLRYHAELHDICFAYIEFLPEFLVDKKLEDSVRKTAESIIEHTNVSVIVSFTKPNQMMYVFKKTLQHHKGRNKVWIASDTWSQSHYCLNTTRWNLKDVGTIFGMTLKSGNITRFQHFLKNLEKNRDQYKNNLFLMDFLNNNSSDTSIKSKINQLIHMIYPFAVFSIELAFKAITNTLKRLCIDKECNITTLQPEKFRDALKTSEMFLDGKKYTFTKSCNVDSGYDIVMWKHNSPTTLEMNYKVGYYDIQQHSLMFIHSEVNKLYDQTKKVSSRCSTCYPGESKVRQPGQPVCCYQCKKCPENYYSDAKDYPLCLACPNETHYSEEGSRSCTKRSIDFLQWDNEYHIVLLAFAGLGVLLTLMVGIIFLVSWKTPVVRSSVGPISILLLFSLLSSFGSVVLFGGEPKDWQCQARQVFFGLSLTLSVSCILVKSFRIIMAFEFDPVTKEHLEKLYKPYLIIPFCMAGQVVICVVWLVYKPPELVKDSKVSKQSILLKCDEMLYPAFGAMLAYIGLLAIICFILAFKGRKLPNCYNDAKFITFSMLIYLIAWIIFGPVYVNVTGKYNVAIEIAVILISTYGILFCLFFTKCYIILFRQEKNKEGEFRESVRSFVMQKDRDLDEELSRGTENPCLSMESLSNLESSHPVTSRERRDSMNSIAKPLFQISLTDTQPTLLQDETK